MIISKQTFPILIQWKAFFSRRSYAQLASSMLLPSWFTFTLSIGQYNGRT